MASKVLMTISKDEAEYFRLVSEYKGQLDYQSKMVYAEQKGERRGKRSIISLLENGKSPEEVIKEFYSSKRKK